MTDTNTAYDTQEDTLGLPDGTALLDDQFTITRRLSAGGFGITYLAQDNTLGRTIVIKECFPEDLCIRVGNTVVPHNASHQALFASIVGTFMHEARSIAKLRHPNIVGVHRAFEENGTAYMALDLIDGHDLLDILDGRGGTRPAPKQIERILCDLLRAVEKIHDQDLLHRDISPDNIIIDKSGNPVLIDFGAARAEASRRTRAISSMLVVKDGYSPQEFYIAGCAQTQSSDIYALGATFYHLLSGEAPANSQLRVAALTEKKPDPCVPLAGRIKGYDPVFLQAIDQAMDVVPNNRLQNARTWLNMISTAKTRVIPIEKTDTPAPAKPITQDLERLLTRMIEETNEEVGKSEAAPKKTAPEAPVVQPSVSKPKWLDEFNEETIRKEKRSKRIEVANRTTTQSKRPPSTRQKAARTRIMMPDEDQNWANVAIEKREKQKSARVNQSLGIHAQAAATRRRPATKRIESEPVQVSNADVGLSWTIREEPSAFEGIAKYLFTGVLLGLATIILFPNLI